MKANELMIGDWVMYNPNVFIEDEYEPHKDCEPAQIESGEDIDLAIEDCFTPIPLTEDILKANGWEEFYYGHFKDENHRHFHRGVDRCLELSLIKGDNCFCTNFSLGRIDFSYVHELQHALRLCGLDELADSFKID